MTEEFKINICRVSFSFAEILNSKEKVFTDILGVDWHVSAKLVKKLEIKKFQSLRIRDISFLSNRIRMTVKYNGLRRKALAVVLLPCSQLDSRTKDIIFYQVCEEGDSTVFSEEKLGLSEELIDWTKLNGEFILNVSPENFFYFNFSNDTSLLKAGVAESSQNIVSELINDFSELYKKQDLSDVVVKCGGEVFKAHKVILSARSPVFAAMFQHRMKENEENVIDIKDMESNVVSFLLEFIYCGKIDGLSVQTAGDLLSAAEKYQLAGLKNACLSFLHCAMSEDNVLSTLSLADLHDASLKKVSIDFVCKEFDHLKDTEEWKRFQDEKPVLANEVLLNIIGFASKHGHKLR